MTPAPQLQLGAIRPVETEVVALMIDPEAEEAVYANSAYVEGKPMVTDSLKLTENCQLLHSGSAFMLSVVFIN